MEVHLHRSHGPCLTVCGLGCDAVTTVTSNRKAEVTCETCKGNQS